MSYWICIVQDICPISIQMKVSPCRFATFSKVFYPSSTCNSLNGQVEKMSASSRQKSRVQIHTMSHSWLKTKHLPILSALCRNEQTFAKLLCIFFLFSLHVTSTLPPPPPPPHTATHTPPFLIPSMRRWSWCTLDVNFHKHSPSKRGESKGEWLLEVRNTNLAERNG